MPFLGDIPDDVMWRFMATREQTLRVAITLLETHKSGAATTELAIRERVAALLGAEAGPHGLSLEAVKSLCRQHVARGALEPLLDELDTMAEAGPREEAAASHLRVLWTCALQECSDPENCEERYPSTLCPRCIARIYVQSLRAAAGPQSPREEK